MRMSSVEVIEGKTFLDRRAESEKEDVTTQDRSQPFVDHETQPDTRESTSVINSTLATVTDESSKGNDRVTASAHEVTTRETKASTSPLRQTTLAWILAGVTVAVYCVTVCYAFGTTGLRYLSFASLNPSNTLAILRVLSEVTAFCLVILISVCIERMLWMLVAKKDGTYLSTFLALHPSSGFWSWIQLILRNAQRSRLFSWLRILIAVVVPAMGVVLLSRVDTRLYFDDHTTFPVAGGIGIFNSTYVTDYDAIIPLMMAKDFSAVLQNEEISWNVPLVDLNVQDCSLSSSLSNTTCGNGYFLHGGFGLITPWPTVNVDMPTLPVYTLHSVHGLQLDFTKLQLDFRFQANECIVLGTKDIAVAICLSQEDKHVINAKFVPCPLTVAGEDSCLDDNSWVSSPGLTLRMTTHARRGTIHFSRNNLTAISLSDLSIPTEHAISATELLAVYNQTLSPKSSGLGSSYGAAQLCVSMISDYLTHALTSAPSFAQAYSRMQNFMAMPLYYFQPTYLSPYTIVPSPNRMLDSLPQDQELYITASLSSTYYGLSIAPWTVWLYTAGIGLTLLACLVVLVLSSLRKFAEGIPETSPWSYIDFAAECRVENSAVAVDREGHLHEAGQTLIRRVNATPGFLGKAKAMRGMKVTLVTENS